MDQVRQIKAMQSQINQTEADIIVLKIELNEKQKEYNNKLIHLKGLKVKVANIENNKKLKVSEHALLRYFERVKGFDLSQIEKEILTESVLKLVDILGGDGTYPNEDHSVVMKNYTVTTIVENK